MSCLVSHVAVVRVVMQRSVRDDTKNGCIEDYSVKTATKGLYGFCDTEAVVGNVHINTGYLCRSLEISVIKSPAPQLMKSADSEEKLLITLTFVGYFYINTRQRQTQLNY